MHEIVTLQLGQRSNYLATHFWNTQESYFTYGEDEISEVDPNIHFRPGVGADGSDTFTPRTVIYDLKGGFGTLKQYNALYEAQQDANMVQGLWDGKMVTHRQTAIQPHQYQQSLELGEPASTLTANSVRYWSDFNRVFFHPRSIVQLNDYELNSQILPFESWAAGEDLFRQIDREVDILDRDLRPIAEECDQISGLQLFTGADDAWGGFASNYVDRIRDEYGKTSLWTFGLENGKSDQRRERILRAENAARTLHSIASQASAYVRISSPISSTLPSYINLLSQSEWYNSALTTLALESLTLPWRFRNTQSQWSSFAGFESILNNEGNQTIFELSASVLLPSSNPESDKAKKETGPASMDQRQRKRESNDDNDEANAKGEPAMSLDLDFTPEDITTETKQKSKHERLFGQILVSRGPDDDEIARTTDKSDEDRWRDFTAETVVQRYKAKTAFPILDSFPHDLLRIPTNPSLISVRSALTSTSRTQARLQSLRQVVRFATGVEERENLSNGLAELSEAYDSGWMSSDDDDDD